MMDRLLLDLRLGLRGLVRSPAFAATAVLTLALGIGLATAVFTVADALLLRRLPVPDQDRVVVLAGRTPDGRMEDFPLGLQGVRDFAARTRTLGRVGAFGYEGAVPRTVSGEGEGARVRRAFVSGDFFAAIGAAPLLGRTLQPEDDAVGAAAVAVLSHRVWQEGYGGSPDVLGRRIELHEDGHAYTIVGVMPQGLDWPRGTDVWAPVLAAVPERHHPTLAFHVIGRLAPSASAAAAREEMTAHFRSDASPAWQREFTGTVRHLPEMILGATAPAVLVFAAASALLLLITCINVANLLLVRGLGRLREVAIRSALGASRRRVVSQLLAENAVLALLGGALGVGVAAAAVRAFLAFAPAELPRLDEIALDMTALLGAVAITATAMLLFAIAPAVATSKVSLEESLRSGSRQRGASRRSRFLGEGLVAAQIALALLVLSAAALLGTSLLRLERAELAFDPSGLLVAELGLRSDQYESAATQRALLDRLLPALHAIPGVESVSPVVAAPFAGNAGWDGRPAREDQSAEEAAANPMLNMEVVSADYFGTIGVPILRGRGFTADDREGAPVSVVLSESAARHYWPQEDPIGKRLRLGPQQVLTVVGVVPDTRYRDLREARPSIYIPLAQSFFPFVPTTLVIRADAPPSSIVPALRRVLAENAPGVVVASAGPFQSYMRAPLAQPRLNAFLLAIFAAAALALTAVGLFGVLATMVRQRRSEFGVRMALGATPAAVSGLVLRRGLLVAVAGATAGLLGAVAANRLLSALLFEVSPTDPRMLLGITAVLLAVAGLASLLPARASTRIEPAVALRAEG